MRNIPPVFILLLSVKNQSQQLTLAGHCLCHAGLPDSKVIVQKQFHGRHNHGRPTKTMLRILIKDADAECNEELVFEHMQECVLWHAKHQARLKSIPSQLGRQMMIMMMIPHPFVLAQQLQVCLCNFPFTFWTALKQNRSLQTN